MEDKDLNLVKRYISNLLAISSAKFLLNESHGVYDPLIPMSEEIIKQILSNIQQIVEKYGVFIGEFYIDISKLDDPFFDSLKIKLQYIDEPVPSAEVSGSYDPSESPIKDGKINITINLGSIGQDNKFVDKLRSTIIHELGHAYDDYMESINSKYGKSYIRREIESIVDRTKLATYLMRTGSIEAELASVISFILKSEREAEQNEFIAEIMHLAKFRVIEGPDRLTAYVVNTRFYQNMMDIRDRLVKIENLIDDSEKLKVTQAFNDIYRNKNVSYDEMCSFLRGQWNKRKNELFKHVTNRLISTTETLVENSVGFSRLIRNAYEYFGSEF